MTEVTVFSITDESVQKLDSIVEELQSTTRFDVTQTNVMEMLIDIAYRSKLHLKGEPKEHVCRTVLDVSEVALENLNRSSAEAGMTPDTFIDLLLRNLLGGTKNDAVNK